jgi:hypothetical protein
LGWHIPPWALRRQAITGCQRSQSLSPTLDLTIDPSEDTYSGVVRIEKEILQQTDRRTSTPWALSSAAEAKLVGSGIEMVGLRLPSTRKPGRALIEIACFET